MLTINSIRHGKIPSEESNTRTLRLFWTMLCLRSELFLVELLKRLRVYSYL